MHKTIKTILDGSGVEYRVRFHKDMPIPIRSPHDFAQVLGYDVGRITKTLLLRATDREEFCLVVLSSDKSANLEKVAQLLKAKRVQMAKKEELARILGYPPTGVSPIGGGSLPVFIDESLMGCPTVLIGAGEVGVEIELSPEALKEVTQAEVAPIAQKQDNRQS
jgi:Cys-tRNA(Pro)/Cys-tRNA(Cys) deacylase